MRRLFSTRFFRYSLITLLISSVIAALAGAGLYYWYIIKNPGEHLSRADIMRRISMESPIYYRDGEEKLGVFFGAEHREYVPFARIPKDFVDAITASEDARFFTHFGIDPRGILRAIITDIRAGKLVAGGSTITQQTAKNLYYRPDRSIKSKLEELVNALRLEYHYSKKEILEFYVNQFHVYSNGRGLGIAARYFFDKDVSELSKLECCFLAGVVKGPFNYNPFVGSTEEKRERARKRARNRTDSVVGRLEAVGKLTPHEANQLRKEELVFKKGEFRYDHNVILDYVFNTLQEERFTTLLADHGIDNPATAGIRVITTIDKDYQRAAQYGLSHNLTDTGGLLEGLTLDSFHKKTDSNLMPVSKDDVQPQAFLNGRVKKAILEGSGAPALEVDLGGLVGRVDEEGLKRVATLLKRAKGKNTWARASGKDIRRVAEELPVGDEVRVSIRNIEEGVPILDLEATTELQGGLIVLDHGQIRAMVGGHDNRNFNRATQAKRQLGSTFKPLTYSAAFGLRWQSLSPLDNRAQGFLFQRGWYWPRAAHHGVEPYVSLAYAGAYSENRASISLLYHLTKHLSEDQMTDLARRVGMAPADDESHEAFIKRIRDGYGIIPNDASLAEGLFEGLKPMVKTDLSFDQKGYEARALEYLPYGIGFDDEATALRKTRLSAEEKEARRRFLARGFLNLEKEAPEAMKAAEVLLAKARERQESLEPEQGSARGGSAQGENRAETIANHGTSRNASRAKQREVQQREVQQREVQQREVQQKDVQQREVQQREVQQREVQQREVQQSEAMAAKHFYMRRDGDVFHLIYSKHPEESWLKPSPRRLRELLLTGSSSATTELSLPSVRSTLQLPGSSMRPLIAFPSDGRTAQPPTSDGGSNQPSTLEDRSAHSRLAFPSDGKTSRPSPNGGNSRPTQAEGHGIRPLLAFPSDGSPATSSAPTGLQPAGDSPPEATARLEDVILLEGTISPASVISIRRQLDAAMEDFSDVKRYDMRRLVRDRDFRVMVGLQYVIQLAKAAGVSSELQPVLPTGLGASEITLLDAAMMYQTFLNGKAYSFDEMGPGTAIIQEIRGPDGMLIYKLESLEHRVLGPEIPASVGRILKEVFNRGTARRGLKAVELPSVPIAEAEGAASGNGQNPTGSEESTTENSDAGNEGSTTEGFSAKEKGIAELAETERGEGKSNERGTPKHPVLTGPSYLPLFGKTGTTNNYQNVAFVGFLPVPSNPVRALPYGEGLTLAAYVGYDDNRPMSRGGIRIAGSSGALPAWLDTARGIAEALDLETLILPEGRKPGTEVEIEWPLRMAPVAVDSTTGLRVGGGVTDPEEPLPSGESTYEIFGEAEDPTWPERERYHPFTPWSEVLGGDGL